MMHNSNDKSVDGGVAPMTYAKSELPVTNSVRIYTTINIDIAFRRLPGVISLL